jgi:peptide/nickel transport system substrate-binding protein
VNPLDPSSKKPTTHKPIVLIGVIRRALSHFSLFERVMFYALALIMTITSLTLLLRVDNLFTTPVPILGGELKEGVVGSARFINPVLAVSDSDRDLTTLIYSGLTRTLPDGTIIPDLAESYNITDDGKTYDFILKKNLTFHDGKPVTASDVEYTIQKIQDPAIKSPKRPNWDGVVVEKVSEEEIKFHLKQVYAPFLLNTTIGILPKHIWKDATPDEFPLSLFNFEPVGSGPYMVSGIDRNTAGLPLAYTLTPFSKYALGTPHIKTISFSFFPNEQSLFDAYTKKSIDSIHSVNPEKLETLKRSDTHIETATLPRIFAVFFNQNEAPLFTDSNIRKALDLVTPKQEIVNTVFNGYGTVNNGPLPPEIATSTTQTSQTKLPDDIILNNARALLAKSGWVYNETTHVLEKTVKTKKQTEVQKLSFSISTGDAPELKKTAELLKTAWEKLGAVVDVKVFEQGDLNQNVIRPRKYDTLLFGEVVGRDLDLYAFWHSSQRNDPGLNVAMYTNSKTDKLLEVARTLESDSDRIEKYQEFSLELTKETPAIFLYSPQFIYLVPNTINGLTLSNITIPSERFANIYEWYIDTERVWKVFAKH